MSNATQKIETITYTLPAYWASYLVNADASGLEDGEQATIDAFVAREGNPIFTADIGEPYFSRYNDAGTLAGDVLEYTAIVRPAPARPAARS